MGLIRNYKQWQKETEKIKLHKKYKIVFIQVQYQSENMKKSAVFQRKIVLC